MANLTLVPTLAKPAAGRIAWGVCLTGMSVLGLLFAAPFAATQIDVQPGIPTGLLWVLLLVGVAGVGLLTSGVLRLVQHADRAAGIVYEAAIVVPVETSID